MINLLPESEKMIARTEYRLRLFAVWLIVLCAGSIASLALLTPSYMLSRYQNEAAQLAATGAAQATKTTPATATLSAANMLTNALAPAATSTSQTDIIAVIANDRGTNAITAFLYSENSGSSPTMTIQGIATDRNSLLGMSQALESEKMFQSVDLPISDLALDVNIPFSIKITIAKQ